MPDDDINAPEQRRRVVLRRARSGGGFTSGHSTESESLRPSTEMDDVDRAIDPDEINSRVRRLPPPASTAPYSDTTGDANEDRENPRMRMNQVAMAGSQSYAKEYRLQLLHRLLMRSVPLDQIAQQLQVSISTVEKDRAELKRRWREAAKELTIEEIIGNESGIYDEITAMAMRVASGGESTPTAMKLASMRTALAARADKTRFMNTAGVFDVLRFKQAEDGGSLSDVQRLMQHTEALLASLDEPDEPTGEPPPRGKRMTRTRAGGFKSMTFDDNDASSSTQETQEI